MFGEIKMYKMRDNIGVTNILWNWKCRHVDQSWPN